MSLRRRIPGMVAFTLPLLLASSVTWAGEVPNVRLLVAAYFYPAGPGLKEWGRLIESPARSRTVVIVNPASGPGDAADPNYTSVIAKAGAAKVTLIGYVTTGYGKRPLRDVEADVDRWVRLYPGVRGVFFDEQPGGDEHVDYMASLYRFVRDRKRLDLVVTNPGTVCSERYLSRPASDAACLFEGPLTPEGLRLPAWTARYAADRVAALPYNVGTAGQMRECLRSAVKKGVGYLLRVTDAGGPMPWVTPAALLGRGGGGGRGGPIGAGASDGEGRASGSIGRKRSFPRVAMPPHHQPSVSIPGEHVVPVQTVAPVRTALEDDERRLAVPGVAERVCPHVAPGGGILLDEVADEITRILELLVKVTDEDVGVGGLEIPQ